MLEFDRIYNSDCIEGMKQIESGGGGKIALQYSLILLGAAYCSFNERRFAA